MHPGSFITGCSVIHRWTVATEKKARAFADSLDLPWIFLLLEFSFSFQSLRVWGICVTCDVRGVLIFCDQTLLSIYWNNFGIKPHIEQESQRQYNVYVLFLKCVCACVPACACVCSRSQKTDTPDPPAVRGSSGPPDISVDCEIWVLDKNSMSVKHRTISLTSPMFYKKGIKDCKLTQCSASWSKWWLCIYNNV